MLVREVMSSPVVTVPLTASVRQAARLLHEHDITAAPVVDEKGHLVGIVSEMDLLTGTFEADPRAFALLPATPSTAPPRLVSEVMTADVRTAHETGDVAELAEVMVATRVKSVPVLRDRTLVGMVSRRDLIGMLARSDARIRDDVLAALASLLPSAADWHVTVADGEVRLYGAEGSGIDRLVEVIARTIPGVSRVTVEPPTRTARSH